MLKSRICVRQTDVTDCGAACLATVARAHGCRIPISLIREYSGTDKRGTTVLGLVEAAQKLGFEARGVRGNVEALAQVPLPCIAHVAQEGLLHFVTILGVTARSVVVADPARGIIRHPHDQFEAIWSGVLILVVPGPALQGRNDSSGRRSGLLLLLRQNRLLLCGTLLASALFTLLGLGTSLYLQVIIDKVLFNNDRILLRWLSAGLILLVSGRAVLGVVRGALSAHISRRMDLSLMLDYYRRVLSMPVAFFETRASGEILSRLADAVKIRTMICSSALTLVIDTATMVAGFAVLLTFSARLAISALLIVPFVCSILFIVCRPLRSAQRSVLEGAAELQSCLVEGLAGIATIKACRAEEAEKHKAQSALTRLLRHAFRAALCGVASTAISEIVMSISIVCLLWGAGGMVLAGKLTVGQMVACYSVLLYMLQPVGRLAELNLQIQDAWIAAERLYEILELPPEHGKESGKIILPREVTGMIELKDVGFRYGARDQVLHEVTLTIQPRSVLALVGESGSGKSTLARLLLRFYHPQVGQIKIDGHDVRELSLDCLRSRIGYVDQNAYLFSGTIEENLMIGARQADESHTIAAVRAVGLEQFLCHLPQRLGTRIGERGLTLSAGQRQLLALARALISDPPVLVLDEATSHLDPAAEQRILELVQELKRRKTIILIGHRLSLARRADRIALLGNGRILEHGSHGELINAGGLYWSLWQSHTLGLTGNASPDAARTALAV